MSLVSSLTSHVIALLERELLSAKQPIIDLIIQEIELLINKLQHILESKKSQKAQS